MNPLITLELSFVKSDVAGVLRIMRINQMHHPKQSRAAEIVALERALESLDRVDAMAASHPLQVREDSL